MGPSCVTGVNSFYLLIHNKWRHSFNQRRAWVCQSGGSNSQAHLPPVTMVHWIYGKAYSVYLLSFVQSHQDPATHHLYLLFPELLAARRHNFHAKSIWILSHNTWSTCPPPPVLWVQSIPWSNTLFLQVVVSQNEAWVLPAAPMFSGVTCSIAGDWSVASWHGYE